jgi:hypothetical protein
VRILAGDVERVAVIGAAVARHGGARLDGVGDEAIVDDVELGDVRGFGERAVDGGLVAQRPGVALVARRAFVQLGRAGLERRHRIDDRR